MVAGASDEQLGEAMSGPQREEALREIFSRITEHLNAERAGAHDAVIHFKILERDAGGYDHFEVIVRGGKATIAEPPAEEPRVTLSVGPVDFLRLITNQVSGPTLFMTGKLKIEGDLMFASQIASLFHIPTASTQKGSN